ncbi:MAG: hypothetical protein RL630_32 [Verrucomicrobiota bacterium]|jgi:hypothetical protein
MDQEKLRQLLCELGTAIRSKVVSARQGLSAEKLAAVTGDAGGDTIFAIDRFGEDAILEWFRSRWPADEPVQIVMEGLESELCFPEGKSAAETKLKCIIDPIDGTRGLMYDKRSAWALAAIAPQRGEETRLSQILATAMTEIPITKQWRADQFSASLDGPLVATWCDWRAGSDPQPLHPEPSTAHSFDHGFASLAKFFPEGRTLTAQIEERLWDQILGPNRSRSPVVFDDQYLSTAGQFHELITGRDRLVGDIRPLVFHALDLDSSLVCHPYDACAWLLLKKSGVVFEHPLGGFPDAPLDTESGVAWIAYANETLAAKARPVLQKILREFLP